MKKIIYYIILSILFAIPISTKALNCNVKELVKFQQLASNIVSSYDYIETFNEKDKYGSIIFNVKLSNINEKFYVVDGTTNKKNYAINNELNIMNVHANSSLTYTVYVKDGECAGSKLLTLYVNLPPYNKYYKDELCKGLENYKICNRWVKVNLTEKEFINTVKKYKEKPVLIEQPVKKKTFEDIFAAIIDFLDRNKLKIFAPIIIISAGLIIYLLYMKKKDEFDLK